MFYGHHLDEIGYCARHIETNYFVEQATGQKNYGFRPSDVLKQVVLYETLLDPKSNITWFQFLKSKTRNFVEKALKFQTQQSDTFRSSNRHMLASTLIQFEVLPAET